MFHALLRNTLIPLVLIIYTLNKERRYDQYYWIFYCLCLGAMLVFFVFAIIGYTPLASYSWRDPYSPLEYLIYMVIIMRLAESRTLDIGYGVTVSIVSAAAAGYLYEVPRWVLLWGPWALFRTAKTSLIILDWGMLCVPLMVYMVVKRGASLYDTKLLLCLALYEIYCVMYYYNSDHLIRLLNSLFYPPIPKTIILRIPALILCGYFVNTIKKD